jgi:hypothetical protein
MMPALPAEAHSVDEAGRTSVAEQHAALAQPEPAPVRPWQESTPRRGRPRQLDTEGSACPRPACADYGITNSAIHALVEDDHHGMSTPSQSFRCQARGTKVTER